MNLEASGFDVAKQLNMRDSGWCAALHIQLHRGRMRCQPMGLRLRVKISDRCRFEDLRSMNAIVVKGREHRYYMLLVIALHVSGSYIWTKAWKDDLGCSSEMSQAPRTHSPAESGSQLMATIWHFTEWKRQKRH